MFFAESALVRGEAIDSARRRIGLVADDVHRARRSFRLSVTEAAVQALRLPGSALSLKSTPANLSNGFRLIPHSRISKVTQRSCTTAHPFFFSSPYFVCALHPRISRFRRVLYTCVGHASHAIFCRSQGKNQQLFSKWTELVL